VRVALATCGFALFLAGAAAPVQASTPGQLAQLGTPLGCITSDASLTACSQVTFASFTEPTDIAVSPDGLNAYAADYVNASHD
jgi:hypothetical protein